MRRLKKSLVLLVLSLLVSLPLWSDSYYITEEQLNELQTTILAQKSLLTTQKEELLTLNQQLTTSKSYMERLQSELNQQSIYLKQLEKNRKLKMIKGIGITIGISVPVGILTGIIIGVNVK